MPVELFDSKSYYVALVIFLFSLILFFIQTSEFWQSFGAALLAALLAWVTYIGLRLIYLTFSTK